MQENVYVPWEVSSDMTRLLWLLVLLLPYATFIAASMVIGAAFFVPNVVFSTIGGIGLLVAVVVGASSLIVIFLTDHTLLNVTRRLSQEH